MDGPEMKSDPANEGVPSGGMAAGKGVISLSDGKLRVYKPRLRHKEQGDGQILFEGTSLRRHVQGGTSWVIGETGFS